MYVERFFPIIVYDIFFKIVLTEMIDGAAEGDADAVDGYADTLMAHSLYQQMLEFIEGLALRQDLPLTGSRVTEQQTEQTGLPLVA